MRDTPETDAEAERLDFKVDLNFARKLERERDEAREERDIARLSAQDSDRAHDRLVGELEKVYKERDEAQNKLRLGKLTIISQKEEIELLRQQLIEARNK